MDSKKEKCELMKLENPHNSSRAKFTLTFDFFEKFTTTPQPKSSPSFFT